MTLSMQPMNQFINSYFRYLAVGMVMLVVAIFWQFLFKPQYSAIQASGVLEYSNITQMIDERRMYLEQLQHMKEEYDQFDQRSLRYVDVALPNNYSQADVFSEIDQLFQDTSLAVQSINVAALAETSAAEEEEAAVIAPTNSEYAVVLITVNVTSRQVGAAEDNGAKFSYAEFKTVLQRIEQNQHLLNLEQLVYSPESDAFTLILKTYQRVTPNEIL